VKPAPVRVGVWVTGRVKARLKARLRARVRARVRAGALRRL